MLSQLAPFAGIRAYLVIGLYSSSETVSNYHVWYGHPHTLSTMYLWLQFFHIVLVWRQEHPELPGMYAYKMYGRFDDISANEFLALQLDTTEFRSGLYRLYEFLLWHLLTYNICIMSELFCLKNCQLTMHFSWSAFIA